MTHRHPRPWWKFWIRAENNPSEAQAELAKLSERDPEVARLARELQVIKHRNNFSGMVDRAIHRSAEGRS